MKNMLAADTHQNILMFNIRTCKMTGELVQMMIL